MSGRFNRILMLGVLSLMFSAEVAHAQQDDGRSANDDTSMIGINPDDPHAQLQNILAKPIYQRWTLRQLRGHEEKHTGDSWVDQDSYFVSMLKEIKRSLKEAWKGFWNWVGRQLRGITPPNFSTPGDTFFEVIKLIAWVVAGCLILFLIYLIWRVAKEGHFSRGKSRILSREQIDHAMQSGEALAMQSTDWLAEADRQATGGNYRAVYRALYLALLSGLHEIKHIQFRRNRTNWTYVNRFKGPEHHRGTFAGLTGLFDDVWYGLKEPDKSRNSLAQVRRQVQQLVGGRSDV